jgi:hypothetical protein
MSKGLGIRQQQLVDLLDTHGETYQGETIVRVSLATKALGIHQSAISRGLKALADRKLIKMVTLVQFTKESITLPSTTRGEVMTLNENKQVGSKVLAYARFDTTLKDYNWEVTEEVVKDKAEHKAVMLALGRLRGVNFVVKKVMEKTDTYHASFNFTPRPRAYIYPERSLKEPEGKLIGMAIPLKYISLESKVPNLRLNKVLSELERTGHVKLAYSGIDRDSSKKIIGVI